MVLGGSTVSSERGTPVLFPSCTSVTTLRVSGFAFLGWDVALSLEFARQGQEACYINSFCKAVSFSFFIVCLLVKLFLFIFVRYFSCFL